MKTRAKWVWAVAVVAALAAGMGLGWSTGTRGRFDPAAWRDERQVERGVRLHMADRIVADKLLSGKTRVEVVEMLGEPPKTGYFRRWDMVYWLGPERGYISIDSEWLVVKLDAQGRVSDYQIVRD